MTALSSANCIKYLHLTTFHRLGYSRFDPALLKNEGDRFCSTIPLQAGWYATCSGFTQATQPKNPSTYSRKLPLFIPAVTDERSGIAGYTVIADQFPPARARENFFATCNNTVFLMKCETGSTVLLATTTPLRLLTVRVLSGSTCPLLPGVIPVNKAHFHTVYSAAVRQIVFS